ncbi:MerR family transcriptional regulator [Bacillus sp. AGMB 02131]|uniref:MerR family transcriptional regulator n=1 Tax=Peribacillus faecalis TaxID=2772559 RepID=A0A927HD21_9BACI|nr:MerR family transcriptional regulator [Peribacillus faecalis]MBD3110121.1 MerR family transcriptional regulator [Peribacillus faecalis]
MNEKFSIGQFSKKTGTTVRTLHYYDEIGLLIPELTASGRRIYNNGHLITLQKILTLKFLGYSLEDVKEFLQDESWDLRDSLTMQREMMVQKRKQLDHIIKALDHALHIVHGEEKIDPAIFVTIINGIQDEEEHKKWLNKVFPEHIVDGIYDIPDDQQREIEKVFAELIAEIKKMVQDKISPDDPKAIQIAKTLFELASELFGEDLLNIILSVNEDDIDEESVMPNPLNAEEEQWFKQAMGHFESQERKNK